MTKVVDLSEARANKSGDCRDWTALDCLKAAVRDIESGDITMPDLIYVAMRRPHEDGDPRHVAWSSYMAGGTMTELLGLLAKHMHDTMAGD